MNAEGKLIHGETTKSILEAFYSVYWEVGYGFLEAVYVNCLSLALEQAGLEVQRQVQYQISFRDRCVGIYRADLVIESRVIVEVKSGVSLIPQHLSQLRNYLRAADLKVGLLLHFGPKPEFRRVVLTRSGPRPSAPSA